MRIKGRSTFRGIDRYVGILLLWILRPFAKRHRPLPPNPRALLVIKLSALGDTLLLIPVLRALKKRYPEATLTFLGSSVNKEVLRVCPYVDRVLSGFFSSLLTLLTRSTFDVTIDFDQWTRISALFAWCSRAPYTIGFRTEGQYRHYLYTHTVPHSRTAHELTSFFALVKVLDVPSQSRNLEFWIQEEAAATARTLLRRHGISPPYLIFHPETTPTGRQKEWPPEHYIALGRKLLPHYRGQLLLSSTSFGRANAVAIARALFPHVRLLPPMNIHAYAACLADASLLVCSNTGVMHLAAALNVPIVALQGPIPSRWGPWSRQKRVLHSPLPCAPCVYLGFDYGCPTNACMRALSVDEVFSAVCSLLARISHPLSENSHTLHGEFGSQRGESVLPEHCPPLSESQLPSAERRFPQREGEKCGLAGISHPQSEQEETSSPQAETSCPLV